MVTGLVHNLFVSLLYASQHKKAFFLNFLKHNKTIIKWLKWLRNAYQHHLTINRKIKRNIIKMSSTDFIFSLKITLFHIQCTKVTFKFRIILYSSTSFDLRVRHFHVCQLTLPSPVCSEYPNPDYPKLLLCIV